MKYIYAQVNPVWLPKSEMSTSNFPVLPAVRDPISENDGLPPSFSLTSNKSLMQYSVKNKANTNAITEKSQPPFTNDKGI